MPIGDRRMKQMLCILTIWSLSVLSLSAQMGTTYRIYTAREGELPSEIANRFNVNIQDILRANPSMVSDQPLKRGQVVLVPLKEQVTKNPESRKNYQPRQSSQSRLIGHSENTSFARAYWIYTVQAGETIESVAKRFGITPTAIAQANNLSTAHLTPGQVLIIPVFEQRVEPRPNNPVGTKSVQSVSSRSRAVSTNRLPVLPAPKVFGYVGTVISSMAFIRSLPSKNASIWNKVPIGTQLIVTTERHQWYGVLMINGATGWVLKSHVRKENRAIFWDDIMRAFGGQLKRDDNTIVSEAMKYLGAPYKYGGTSPVRGLDCSAFVQRVFITRGIRLPRTAAEQAQIGIPVPFSDLRSGDRLYFAVKGKKIDHCGIYIGNGLFIHASGRHDAVVISSLSEPLYSRSLVAIRR